MQDVCSETNMALNACVLTMIRPTALHPHLVRIRFLTGNGNIHLARRDLTTYGRRQPFGAIAGAMGLLDEIEGRIEQECPSRQAC